MATQPLSTTPRLNILSTMALRHALNELIPTFTAASGIQVEIEYGATAHLSERIRAGARGDLLLAVAGSVDELINEDILKTGSRVDLVSSDVAMAVALSAPVPDISSQDAFIATLKAARSIAFSKQGASGMYFASLIKRLGLDEEVRAKATVLPEGLTGALVANGEVELAVQQMSELMQVPGINIFGKLPPAVQQSTVFSVGVFKESTQGAAVTRLIQFLQTSDAMRAFAQQGLDPV
ncbi:MAG: substrate-binding domain-containing protein [Burkholderiaceae bacterium]|nr:substrate-binding domain-containing protein [Burkholderiaceae bacterium]